MLCFATNICVLSPIYRTVNPSLLTYPRLRDLKPLNLEKTENKELEIPQKLGCAFIVCRVARRPSEKALKTSQELFW